MELYLGSQYVNDFNFLGRTYQVRVQADEAFRKTPEDIARLKVRNASGEMVPIGTVATFKSTSEPYRLPRYNLFPAAEVMGAAAPGSSSGEALARMEQLADQVLPNGISYEWTDLAHQEKTQTTSPLTVFLASALFVFLVLAAQYESWKTRLAIVLIVPMCLLAAAPGLNVRGLPIDFVVPEGF